MHDNHLIVVDASRKIVWDCTEDYGPKMDLLVFDHCVDDDAQYCVVLELKRLTEQPIGKRDQKLEKLIEENERRNESQQGDTKSMKGSEFFYSVKKSEK